MSDERLAWEDHSLDVEQLDLFAPEHDTHEPHPGAYDEPAEKPRNSQMSELAGSTWEDAFGNAA